MKIEVTHAMRQVEQTDLQLYGGCVLHNSAARHLHLQPRLLRAWAGAGHAGHRPRARQLRALPRLRRPLPRLQPLLHVHGQGGSGQARMRWRLRGPRLHAWQAVCAGRQPFTRLVA